MSHHDIPWSAVLSAFRVLLLRARLRGRIQVGFDTQVGPGCRIVVAKGGLMRLHGVTLSRAVTLEASAAAVLEIGNSWLGPGVIVSARDRITIGHGTALAEYVTVRDHDHVHGPGHPVLAWEYKTNAVVIKDDVWLASKVTVVAGVTIEDHALCAAGAVVTRDVQAWQRVGGVPARSLGSSHRVA